LTDRLSRWASNVQKSMGKNVAGSADAIVKKTRYLNTGSFDLNRVLGGGVPVGRVTMFYGEKSGGKSTNASRTIGKAQELCRNCLRPAKNVVSVPPSEDVLKKNQYARWHAEGECDCVRSGYCKPSPPKQYEGEAAEAYKKRVAEWKERNKENSYDEYICAWVDPEDAYDPEWGRCLGCDPRRILFIAPATGEEGVDLVTDILSSGQLDLVVVDSLANFIPQAEFEASAEKWQQGLQARIVNKATRKWIACGVYAKRDGHDVTQIWINQMRTTIGVMFGDPSVKPAGRGQDFAISAEVRFMNSKVESIDSQYGTKKEIVSIPIEETLRFRNTKNRSGATKSATGAYTQALRTHGAHVKGQVIEDEYLFKLTMYYLIDSEAKYDVIGRSFKTQKAVLEAIRGDVEFVEQLKHELMTVLLEKNFG